MNRTIYSLEAGMPASPSEAVTLGIAERKGVDQTDLPPLYETIDPDALEAVVESGGSCSVSFEYAGYDVTVDGSNSVSIHESL